MAVSGTATLAGTLGVSLIDGYQPAQGASTSFLTANAVTGSFGSVVNTIPGNAYAFSADYSAPKAVSVVVTTVPVRRSGGLPGCKGPASWWPACREP